ncbi:MAG: PHP domain-containing protein [Clostridia bacterium]|nr:PHP domain-containing protein [Clostridia bacterium]
MEHLQNLHMHSTYCDGKNTPREIAEWALAHGFESIGYSGHSYMHWKNEMMNPETTEKYKKEIKALKKEYEGRLGIYLGTEFEMHSEIDLSGYDYIIASTHYFKIGEKYVGFDSTKENIKKIIDEYFCGDGLAFTKAYYEQISNLPSRGSFDIVGHFDICAKHAETTDYFDAGSAKYRSYAIEAAEALAGKIPFFEVNTGAISRGYKKVPYPEPFIIKEFKRLGLGAVITSDCHDMTKMDAHFYHAAELLLSLGFKERYILTDSGFTAVKL